MKISGAPRPLLLLLFLMASFTLALNGAGQGTQVQDDPGLTGPEKCCKDYTMQPVPCHRFKSYHYTDARCPRPAIIFVTKKEVCANPEDDWVQQCRNELPPPGY